MTDTTERKQLGETVKSSKFVEEIEEAPLDYADASPVAAKDIVLPDGSGSSVGR
jgi:hypothetical protein